MIHSSNINEDWDFFVDLESETIFENKIKKTRFIPTLETTIESIYDEESLDNYVNERYKQPKNINIINSKKIIYCGITSVLSITISYLLLCIC